MFSHLLRSIKGNKPKDLPEPDAKLALGALLVRVAKSDRNYNVQEIRRIDRIFQQIHGLNPVAAAKGLAPANVTVTGLRRRGRYAEGYEPVLFRQIGCGDACARERIAIGDVMIARADQHDILGFERMRCKRDGRCRVAPHGLDHELRVGRDIGGLRRCVIHMTLADDDDGRGEDVAIGASRKCLLI